MSGIDTKMKIAESLLTFGTISLYHGSEDIAFPNAEPSLPSKSLLRLYKKASRRDQLTEE